MPLKISKRANCRRPKYEEGKLLFKSIKFRDKTRAKVSQEHSAVLGNRRSASRSAEYYRQQQIMNLLFELPVRRVFARFRNLPPAPTTAIIFHHWRLIETTTHSMWRANTVQLQRGKKMEGAENSSLEATYVVLRWLAVPLVGRKGRYIKGSTRHVLDSFVLGQTSRKRSGVLCKYIKCYVCISNEQVV